jgi:hypothetical protein
MVRRILRIIAPARPSVQPETLHETRVRLSRYAADTDRSWLRWYVAEQESPARTPGTSSATCADHHQHQSHEREHPRRVLANFHRPTEQRNESKRNLGGQ